MSFLTRTVVRREKLGDNSVYRHKVSPCPLSRKDIWIENFVSKPIPRLPDPCSASERRCSIFQCPGS